MDENDLNNINNKTNNFITYIIIGLAVIIVCLIVAFYIKKAESFNVKANEDIQMSIGQEFNIFEKIEDDKIDASLATLDVNNEGIVNINFETGNIEAIGNGEAIITIRSKKDSTYEKQFIIRVKDGEPWIKFESTSYSCEEDEVIDTLITAGGTEIPTTVSNYNSSDTSIATIESGFSDGSVTNCLNCKAVHITCKKKGETTLTANSKTNAKINVKILVE